MFPHDKFLISSTEIEIKLTLLVENRLVKSNTTCYGINRTRVYLMHSYNKRAGSDAPEGDYFRCTRTFDSHALP